MSDTVLKMCDVSFAYRGGQNVLSALSMEIQRGEKLAILGRNGAGKTTLLHLLIGLKRPSSGSILLGGTPVGYTRKELVSWRQSVSIVFQNPDDQVFAPTVEQDVSFGPTNLGLAVDQIDARVRDSLRAMGLEEYRSRSPIYLSGGEKKRVAIAGALAMNPEILLLDEPTSALDDESQRSLNKSLAFLHQSGVTIVASTHDLNFAWRWADRIVLVSEGRVSGDAPARELLMDGEALEKAGLQQPLLAKLASLLGYDELFMKDPAVAREICRSIQQRVGERI